MNINKKYFFQKFLEKENIKTLFYDSFNKNEQIINLNKILNSKNDYDLFNIFNVFNLTNQDYQNEWKLYLMKHSNTYKIFIRYLKENNLYKQYFINLKKNKYEWGVKLPSNYLLKAFLWEYTNEGYHFWQIESIKWKKFMENLNVNFKIIKNE